MVTESTSETIIEIILMLQQSTIKTGYTNYILMSRLFIPDVNKAGRGGKESNLRHT